ncbi:MAG: hypothetical protein B6U89_00695 [Desulfurococcales archaeon ex4484_58]|nr:MAG: hypothetical protein B6U89_00695 [Desulfurococcales archaeon ex4484_58]
MYELLALTLLLFIIGYLLAYVILRKKTIIKDVDLDYLKNLSQLINEKILVRWFKYKLLFDKIILYDDDFKNLLFWFFLFMFLGILVWVFKFGF